MEPAGFGAHEFRNRGGEGNHIMAHFGFDFVDALEIKVRLVADCFGGFARNNSGFGERFRCRQFDLEPGAKPAFIRPEAAHFRAGIARDQSMLLSRSQTGNHGF